MFSRFFETADQRRVRETKREYELVHANYGRWKRNYRVNAATDFSLSNPGCSFLMSDFFADFLMIDPMTDTLVSGTFIDDMLVQPEFVGDHEPAAKWISALQEYRDATRMSGYKTWKRSRGPVGDMESAPNVLRTIELQERGYSSRAYNIKAITYVAVRRNDQTVMSVNAFQPKPHLFFASYLPAALARFEPSSAAMNSRLTIEIATPDRVHRFEEIYDDFHKLKGPGVGGFRSMLEMCVEFLTVAERMTHDAISRLKFQDDLDRELEIENLCDLVSDLDKDALMRA